MPYKLNIFTGLFDYYETGGSVISDGAFDFMSGADVDFMDGNFIDYMSG